MYTSVNVHNRLQELDVPHEMFKLSGPVAGLSRAASSLGLEQSQVAKAELFYVDGTPVVIVIPGDREVDIEKFKEAVEAKRVEPVAQDDVPIITGYLSRDIPPIAHKTEMATYIDYYTLREDVIYTSSGEPSAILKIRSYDLVRATDGEIADIVRL